MFNIVQLNISLCMRSISGTRCPIHEVPTVLNSVLAPDVTHCSPANFTHFANKETENLALHGSAMS